MRWSQYPVNTTKETPADADVVSQQLMLRAGHTMSALELAEHMYAEDRKCESNVVAQIIFRLRRKLDRPGRMSTIETIRFGGYRFTVPRGRMM